MQQQQQQRGGFDQAQLLTAAREAADIKPQAGRIRRLRTAGKAASTLSFVRGDDDQRPTDYSSRLTGGHRPGTGGLGSGFGHDSDDEDGPMQLDRGLAWAAPSRRGSGAGLLGGRAAAAAATSSLRLRPHDLSAAGIHYRDGRVAVVGGAQPNDCVASSQLVGNGRKRSRGSDVEQGDAAAPQQHHSRSRKSRKKNKASKSKKKRKKKKKLKKEKHRQRRKRSRKHRRGSSGEDMDSSSSSSSTSSSTSTSSRRRRRWHNADNADAGAEHGVAPAASANADVCVNAATAATATRNNSGGGGGGGGGHHKRRRLQLVSKHVRPRRQGVFATGPDGSAGFMVKRTRTWQ
jgi:hypothetical protein